MLRLLHQIIRFTCILKGTLLLHLKELTIMPFTMFSQEVYACVSTVKALITQALWSLHPKGLSENT